MTFRLYCCGYDFGSADTFQVVNQLQMAAEKEFEKFQIVNEQTGKIYFPIVTLVEGGKSFDNQRTTEPPISFEGN